MQLMSPARTLSSAMRLSMQFLWLWLVVPTGGIAASDFGPQPAWHFPAIESRLVTAAPTYGSESIMVSLPKPAGVERIDGLYAAAVHEDGHALACVPLSLDASNVWIRIATSSRSKRPNGSKQCAVYVTDKSNILPGKAPTAPHQPVALTLNILSGRRPARSWSHMRSLLAKRNAKKEKRRLGKVITSQEWEGFHMSRKDKDGKSHPRNSTADIQSVILPPAAGSYRFALNSHYPSFLLIDGELVASGGGEHAGDDWKTGDPVVLLARPMKIELVTTAMPTLSVKVGWILPGSPSNAVPLTIPATAYAAVTMPASARLEVQSEPLYANFTYKHARPYRFRESPTIFSKVSFTGIDVNWMKAPVRYQWVIDGVPQASTAHRFTQTLNNMSESLVTLAVRDTLGFTNSQSHVIKPTSEPPHEYAVDAEMGNLPPACYPTDIVHPVLLLNGATDGGMPLVAAWHLTGPGLDLRGEQPVQRLRRQRIDLPLGRYHAADLSRIDWSINHHGTPIAAGVVRFEKPPYRSVPSRAEGPALFNAAGQQVVLVANQYADQYRQPPITTTHAFGHIACLDDFICPNGDGGGKPPYPTILERIINGADHPQVSYYTTPQSPAVEQRGYLPLLKLLQAPGLAKGSDVVVLSLARRDMRDLASPERYERYAAALTDLLSATLGYRVVWVTPPPFEGNVDQTRPYAAAIRRVADARNIPVADLFTAATILGQQESLFHDAAAHSLSEQGQALAAELCARALLSGPDAKSLSHFKRSRP